MIPTLETISHLLRASNAPNYIQAGEELQVWLDEDWPNALARIGELVPAALTFERIAGHVATLVALQRQMDALKPNDLRSRVRIQQALFAAVKSLTQTLTSDVRNGSTV